MADSLLAHLYTRIKGSQEDVATMALQYIISSSSVLNAAFNKLISDSLMIQLEPDISYNCQSVGDNSERPDMSGVDKEGNEVVLCEMKFYAGLTSNQPNGYLDRLKAEKGKGLVFVCPEARRISLWNKVIYLCENNNRIITNNSSYNAVVDDIALTLITWNEIIEMLRRVASSSSVESLPDIAQLAGFCNKMDREAFIPFTTEELGPETPRRENRYYHVVDAVIEKLNSMKGLNPSTKGVRATPYWMGYSRAIRIKDHYIVLTYDRMIWARSSAETPFWLSIRDLEWNQPERYYRFFDSIPSFGKETSDGRTILPIFPLTDSPLEDIADNVIDQIFHYLEHIDSKDY